MRQFKLLLILLTSLVSCEGPVVAAGSSGYNRTVTTAPSEDYLLDVSKGNVPGTTSTIVRGHQPSQSAISGFVDISEFGDLTYLAAAETMEITSTHADDDGAPLGLGLQTVLVQGVDGTGAAIQEIITLNGTANVQTTLSYLRVNSMIGQDAGATGWNVGNITATASTAATIQDEMDATEALSQSSHYTVPLGVTAYLYKVELNCAKISGGGASPEVDFTGRARIGGAGKAWLQLFDKKLDTSATDELDIILPFPTAIPARTDIRFQSDTDKDATESRTRMYLLLVDN